MSKKSGKNQKTVGGYYKKETNLTKKETLEIQLGEEEEELPDFSYLSKLPVNAQSHLILKSEQEKFEGESIVNCSKFFNIDIKLLNAAIKSIPFNELYVIKDVEWTDSELDQINETAAFYENEYKELIKKNSNIIDTRQEKSEAKFKELTINPSEKVSQQTEIGEEGSKQSMEKWLDDILDV